MLNGGKRANSGRKPGVPNLIKKILQDEITDADVELALGTLRKWMVSDNPKAAVAACTYLLNQKFGAPRQSVDVNDERPFTGIVWKFTDGLTLTRGFGGNGHAGITQEPPSVN